ncbi:unnamed protein product [Caenorhabditis sp. 36 PRJEB53466]|nr:unnamed protein product [Caenorhabditis sp. 36 PRJEB53466]
MSYENHASVWLYNKSDYYYKVRVRHHYTDQGYDDSGWKMLKPGGEVEVFDSITFWTGVFTTGGDTWKVAGLRMKEVKEENELTFKFDGKVLSVDAMDTIYEGDWYDHMLHPSDDGKTVCVYVRSKDLVTIESPSHTSECQFLNLFDYY